MSEPPFRGEVPAVLADLEAALAATLGADGRVWDANAGFEALLDRFDVDHEDVRDLFVRPTFDDLAGGETATGWQLRHEGLLHVGDAEDALSLTGTVHADGDEVVLLAELDVASERKARDKVLALNRELNEAQREMRRELAARKRAERRLEEKTEALERSNERLEEFAYVVSHDLQEPLRRVTGYLDLLDNDLAEGSVAKARDRIAEARAGAERMSEMIDGLLTYARIDQDTEHRPVDLASVVDAVLEDLQLRVEETDAEVHVGKLPTVEGDEGQLGHLVQNLVANALDHAGPAPRIEIGAQAVDEDTVRCYVADDGPGIDPDQQEKLFDLFERGTETGGDGTGVGLAVCQRIVERHGGEIAIASAPGEGTEFRFTLPLAEPGDGMA